LGLGLLRSRSSPPIEAEVRTVWQFQFSVALPHPRNA
jgi:hypothetical protein